MAAANYFWVQLDRARAAQAYKRLLDAFPAGKYMQTAEWRIAWVGYLDHKPEANDLLLSFLDKYAGSSYTADAIYWLGRKAGRGGNVGPARSLFKKNRERHSGTLFWPC